MPIAVYTFQFTLPCRERLTTSPYSLYPMEFQFTLPCRERPGGGVNGLPTYTFQFTLPCRERPQDDGHRDRTGRVSIHAPV